MAKVTRRAFLSTTVGAAGGVAAMGLVGPHGIVEAAQSAVSATGGSAEPMMAYVRDASKGEVSVLVGHREVVTHDPALVRHLQRAAG